MKTQTLLIIALIVTPIFTQAELAKYEWKATLKIIDDNNLPVAGAKVQIWYGTNEITGVSDANGRFIASHSDATENLGFQAEKTGYYPFRMDYHKGRKYSEDKFNPSQDIILKRIIRPIAMFAKQITGGPPVFNQSVGYDLMAGDWVAPWGKGQISDIVFRGELHQKAKNDFDYRLVVSFPNEGDGIQGFNVPTYYLQTPGSALRSSQSAPTNGYQEEVVRTMSRHPSNGTQEDMNDPKRNYYFRARTVTDQKGNVISTLYGKIYGDFMQFRYYLNPTPNDPDVEFDPSKNLIKNLKPLEVVKDP